MNDSPIALPIKIESGEVVTFTADVGFFMPDAVMDIRRGGFGVGEITHKEALIHLRDHQLNLVGEELRWTYDEGWKDNKPPLS